MKLVEVIRPLRADAAKVALFDFDGTLSLVRSGWVDVMAPMMVEALLETQSGESEEQLRAVANDFIARLTGKQTIYQMIELADQVKRRGGARKTPSCTSTAISTA